jgi:RNA polymerase sigma-70 factor (ECF subfamily)
LEAFHAGTRSIIETCYREHFLTVDRAIGEILRGADRETVVHEVFSRLIAREALRRSFRGGSLGAWLTAVARNQAIDYRRRLAREAPLFAAPEAAGQGAGSGWEEATEARLLIERFRREHLPPAWADVFELCFLRQLSQREASAELGISRTTLAYRELRIRRRLRRFLLEGEP